ncbi:hypothetical protein E1176_01010 [Fulvivirga sp. RKSG066]|uniref:hypothetical protein n=1 Tax=Fulvivirga aurantia TaxID=2529383 RepID=UPI0012BBA4FF|nr:hypothetical protein [Fulvivirga aurantia]MTI19591.1 hypothetical protein [Fulvivirga aurantia]
MKSIIYVFLLVALPNCSGKGNRSQNNIILGKWIGYKTITMYEGDTTKVSNNNLQEIFFKDSVYWGFANAKGYEILPYSIHKDHLIINGEELELLELSDSVHSYKRKTLIPDKYRIYIFRKAEGLDW